LVDAVVVSNKAQGPVALARTRRHEPGYQRVDCELTPCFDFLLDPILRPT
jgi:hypothetical protein